MAGNILKNRLNPERPHYGANREDAPEFVSMESANSHAVSPFDEKRRRQEYDLDKFEKELEAEELRQEKHEKAREKLKNKLTKVVQIVLVIGCVYMAFLIYGVLKTEYVYGRTGEIEPLVRNISDIKEESEYTTIKTQYIQARTLYERVLTLDYRLGMGIEDPLLIAPEYEKILESISKLSVQIGALTVPAQYTQPMNMLLNWVQNDIALYCQYISRAITQNSSGDMQQALLYKDVMYQNFRQITQVIVTLGTQVPNQDISDMAEWTPESFIQQLGGDMIE